MHTARVLGSHLGRLFWSGSAVLFGWLGCQDRGPATDLRRQNSPCSEHASRGVDGACACDAGYEMGAGNTCVRPSPQPQPDMAGESPQCGPHGQVIGGRCICADLYVAETSAGPCVPGLDLEPAELRARVVSSTESYSICSIDKNGFVRVANRGLQNAPTYKVRLGFFSLDKKRDVESCEFTVKEGTRARGYTRLEQFLPDCACALPRDSIPPGRYAFFVEADTGFEVREAEETNNRLIAGEFLLPRDDLAQGEAGDGAARAEDGAAANAGSRRPGTVSVDAAR